MSTVDVAAPPLRRDVEDVLRERGMTPFHRKAVIVTGVAWTFVAMEILLIGFVVPIFDNLWNLNGRTLGLVTSAALAGSLVGSLTLGRLADRIGRRQIFPVLDPLVRALHGADRGGVGPVVGDDVPLPGRPRSRRDARRRPVDALKEYLPPQRRGRFLVFLDFWWPVGLLLATGLAYIFLGPTFDRFGDDSWRYLFLAAAFPAFLAFLVRRTLPESPYFLARRGRSRRRPRC